MTAIWKQNQDAMRAFQADAERVGYERRRMEEAIERLERDMAAKVEKLDRARYVTLYGLKDDPEHNADGTPKTKREG